MATDVTGGLFSGGSPLAAGSPLGTAALAGGAGLAGLFMARGGPDIPPQFGPLTANASELGAESGNLYSSGNALIAGGQSALGPAMAGQLTPEQQATLAVNRQQLGNVAAQEYASMGRNPNEDTSFISTQTDINTKLLAAANAFVQTNIDAAFKEIATGGALTSQGTQALSAADSVLLDEAKMQMAADQEYSKSLTDAFSAIGSIVGGVAGFAIGGPAGGTFGMMAGSKF